MLGVLWGAGSALGCWECFGVVRVLWGAGSALGCWGALRWWESYDLPMFSTTLTILPSCSYGFSPCIMAFYKVYLLCFEDGGASGDTNEYSK